LIDCFKKPVFEELVKTCAHKSCSVGKGYVCTIILKQPVCSKDVCPACESERNKEGKFARIFRELEESKSKSKTEDTMETKKDDVSMLKSLGSKQTEYAYDGEVNPKLLETFPNAFPDRLYWVRFKTSEFTSLCPKTGQSDWATITIKYIPAELCVESKSLKLYVGSYRNSKSFMETIIGNMIAHLVDLLHPNKMIITGEFHARGGITTDVVAQYTQKAGHSVSAFLMEELEGGRIV